MAIPEGVDLNQRNQGRAGPPLSIFVGLALVVGLICLIIVIVYANSVGLGRGGTPSGMVPISPGMVPISPGTVPISLGMVPISPGTVPISPGTLPISPGFISPGLPSLG